MKCYLPMLFVFPSALSLIFLKTLLSVSIYDLPFGPIDPDENRFMVRGVGLIWAIRETSYSPQCCPYVFSIRLYRYASVCSYCESTSAVMRIGEGASSVRKEEPRQLHPL